MCDWTRAVRERLAQLGDDAPDEGLVEELAAHLAQAFEDARAEGLGDAAATARALATLDASAPLRATLAARRPPPQRRLSDWTRREPMPSKGSVMSSFNVMRDIRHALRLLLRAPGFSSVAILTFAVGIGINTAVFNVVNGVLLRPLPYPDANRITMVWMDNRRQGIREDITSYPNYADWRAQNTSYAHMAAFTPSAFSLTGDGEPERLLGASVTANFFDVMQVAPQIGRVFTADQETAGRDAVVLLSHGLWQRRFGGAPDVVGRTVLLNGRAHEVIGIMPPSLRWPEKAELWKPLAPADQLRAARSSFWLPVIGRLKPGVTITQAQAEMDGIAARLAEQYPANRGFGVYLVGLREQLVGSIEPVLVVLLASVGFVLLIACVNLANLMTGRTAARRRELAVRTALGAPRARLVRQIVTETFVLAVIGGAVGVLLAYWATGFFVVLGGDGIPRQEAIGMDVGVLVFAFLLATVATLLAGLGPALQASRQTVAAHLREGGRDGAALGDRRTPRLLVAAEVAMALVLLAGAGLFIRTLASMQNAERGFDAAHVAMMTVSLPAASYRPEDIRGFYARLLARVRALPGVTSAASGTGVLQPLVTNSNIFSVEGKALPPPEERIEYPVEIVSPGYFETVGMTLVRGRGFGEMDHATAPPAVIVNETFARAAWGDDEPVGRRIRPGDDSSQAPWMTVVGVIRDAHRSEVTRAIRPEIYLCTLQSTLRTQTLLVRTAGDPDAIVSSIRGELRAIDAQLPLFGVTTLERELALTLRRPRFQAVLLGGFAVIALLLASIGIYGVTAHAVSQRTQEVGIRMAMGAVRRDVLRLMMLEHLRPALVGLTIGIVAALALSRFVRGLLFGVSATDPVTLVMVAALLLIVAAAACLVPALRATRVDPLVALRGE